MLEHMQEMDRAIYKLRNAYERLQPPKRTAFAHKLLRIAKIHLAEDINSEKYLTSLVYLPEHDATVFANFWSNRQEEEKELAASIKDLAGVDLLELKKQGIKLRPDFLRYELENPFGEGEPFDMVAPGVRASFSLKSLLHRLHSRQLVFRLIPFLRKPGDLYFIEIPVEQAHLARKLAKKYPSYVEHNAHELDSRLGYTTVNIHSSLLDNKQFRNFFKKLKLTPFHNPYD